MQNQNKKSESEACKPNCECAKRGMIDLLDSTYSQFEYVQGEANASKPFSFSPKSFETSEIRLTLGDVLAKAARIERKRREHAEGSK